MSEANDQDRSEQASPYKLEQARKQGQAARSADVSTLASVAVAILLCFGLAPTMLQHLAQLLARGLAHADQLFSGSAAAAQLSAQGLEAALVALAPLLFALLVMGLLTGLLQTGFIWSTKAIKPDWKRLNPVQGLKRFWSIRLLYEAFKNLLKLSALAAVCLWSLKALAPSLPAWMSVSPKGLLFLAADQAGTLLARLCAVLLVFALVDWVFVRWDFLRQLRMSKREVQDEHKHREGDPRIKSRQRDIRQQFLQRTRSIQRVPEAAVVVTNPTHLAIALKYEHGVSPAPQVLAKGRGFLAQRIRRAAQRAGVPVVHSPVLARALFKEVADNAYVPSHLYPPVARILVWLHAQREGMRPAAHKEVVA